MDNEIKIQDFESAARFAKALGHPVRLAILRVLIEKGRCPNGCHPCTCGANCEGASCTCGCTCGTLVERLPLSQSTVSQHIKELKNAGLINSCSRKGDYTLNHIKLSEGLICLLDLLDLNDYKTMEDLMKCNCGPDCQCGDDCQCGPDCKCGENCDCGDKCDCGPDCKCGDDCQCGPDCKCGEK